jgi:hypothetical protein
VEKNCSKLLVGQHSRQVSEIISDQTARSTALPCLKKLSPFERYRRKDHLDLPSSKAVWMMAQLAPEG